MTCEAEPTLYSPSHVFEIAARYGEDANNFVSLVGGSLTAVIGSITEEYHQRYRIHPQMLPGRATLRLFVGPMSRVTWADAKAVAIPVSRRGIYAI